MIYIIVTSSFYIETDEIRKSQYTNCINKLKQIIEKDTLEWKVIIVENNGLRKTFFDDFGYEVHYTNNNSIQMNNKGYNELKDVIDTITKYNIQDTDFVIKITGRYILEDDSEFISTIKNLDNTNYDCVIKYGNYGVPVDYKTTDCITGIIGMRSYYIKQIKLPTRHESVECNWAKVTYLIDDNKIHKVNTLGIHICPGYDSISGALGYNQTGKNSIIGVDIPYFLV